MYRIACMALVVAILDGMPAEKHGLLLQTHGAHGTGAYYNATSAANTA